MARTKPATPSEQVTQKDTGGLYILVTTAGVRTFYADNDYAAASKGMEMERLPGESLRYVARVIVN